MFLMQTKLKLYDLDSRQYDQIKSIVLQFKLIIIQLNRENQCHAKNAIFKIKLAS